MKTTFMISIFLAFISQILCQSRFDVKFILDGYLREAIISKPSKSAPSGGYPIVIMLHGTGQDGPMFYDISGWKELGEEENFITVFPTSLSWCYVSDSVEKHNLRWVCGSVTDNPCSGSPQIYVNDVKFLKVLAKRISDSLPVNKSMIFASGFSNGDCMIHKLAMDAGDVFAAVAGSGSFLAKGDSTRPVKRIPVWNLMGSNDEMHLFPPYTEIPFGGDSILEYFNYPINRMLVCQGLTQSYTKTETTLSHTYNYSENQNNEISQLYRFSLLKGMYHVYPNGKNYPLNAPKIFWEFFKGSVNVASKDLLYKEPKLLVYPNPSSEVIQLTLLNNREFENLDLSIYNIQGKLIYHHTTNGFNSIAIHKTDIGTGIFNLRIQTGKKLFTSKIVFY